MLYILHGIYLYGNLVRRNNSMLNVCVPLQANIVRIKFLYRKVYMDSNCLL